MPSERDMRGIVRDVRSARVLVETGIARRRTYTLTRDGKKHLQSWKADEDGM